MSRIVRDKKPSAPSSTQRPSGTIRASHPTENPASGEVAIANHFPPDDGQDTATRLRAVVANAPIILFATDRDGLLTVCDGHSLDAMGKKPGELLGQSAGALLSGLSFTGGGLSEGPPMTGEQMLRRALDGVHLRGQTVIGDRTFDTRLIPRIGGEGGGEIVGVIGVSTEVTERVQAERALADEQRRLVATLQSIGEGVVATDASGRVTQINPVAEDLCGVARRDALGKQLEDVVALVTEQGEPPVGLGARDGRADGAWRTPLTRNDLFLVGRDGRRRAVAATRTTIRDEAGHDGGTVVVLRDMREEAGFRAVIETSPELIIVRATDGRILYVNGAVVSRLGFDASRDVIGRPFAELLHEDDRAVAVEPLPSASAPPVGGPLRLMRKDGEIVHTEKVVMPLVFDGEPAVVVVARDVTERNDIEAQLLRADRMSALGTLAAGVAHEINNPLTYMLVNVELVQRRLRALAASDPAGNTSRIVAPLVEALSHAAEGATRVRAIVRSLATFSRGDLDQRGVIDVRSVVESSIQMAMHEIRHRARVVRVLKEVPPVEANEARLGQVFLNLLVNAAHAIPEGDSTDHEIRVQTDVDAEGRVTVEISDTGRGIAPDVLPRVFDPFFTTKPVGEGSGLGLSISLGTVKSLGGDLQVESRVGKGTLFRVLLPSARGWPKASNCPTTGSFVVRRRVLIVDDDEQVRGALARALEDEHDVETVAEGREALDRLTGGARFDLVICDLLMPGMTGMDFYGEVLRVAPELIGDIVFMTGGACTPRARAFVESIGNRCVEKPIDLVKLREILRTRGARDRSSFV